MKQYVLKTVNHKDEIIEESTLTLKEGSMLIAKVPDDHSYEQAKCIHDYIARALENESDILTIKECIKLQVLEIK
ncbi:hypothetical protein A616_16490 [Brevibacillus brevis X23]|nr:hypothetical protein A616_16490 [Brevibacillus brevis X23]